MKLGLLYENNGCGVAYGANMIDLFLGIKEEKPKTSIQNIGSMSYTGLLSQEAENMRLQLAIQAP